MKKIKGDLIQMALNGDFDIIAHGANCCNIMGAGIAKQIKDYFPLAFSADYWYRLSHILPDRYFDKDFVLIREPVSKIAGKFSIGCAYVNEKLIQVVNLYTQLNTGPDFKLEFLEKSLTSLLESKHILESDKIGLPLIGCGIGGGNKEEVLALIEKIEKMSKLKQEITIVEYEGIRGT